MAVKVELFDRLNFKSIGTFNVNEVPEKGKYIIVPAQPPMPAERYQVAAINHGWHSNQIDFVIYVVPSTLLKEKTTP